MIIVGDRCDTDIKFGSNAGIDSCAVLTGVLSSVEEVRDSIA